MRDFRAHLKRTSFDEPMVYPYSKDESRLASWSAAADGLQLGRTNGRRNKEATSRGIDMSVSQYRRRSMEFLENLKSDRTRRFQEIGAMSLTPRSSAGMAALLSPRTFTEAAPASLTTKEPTTHTVKSMTDPPSASNISSSVNIADVATAAAAAVLASKSSEAASGPSFTEERQATGIGEEVRAKPKVTTGIEPESRNFEEMRDSQTMHRTSRPIIVSGDPVKDKLINELLKKGATEDMLYQVISRYEAAKMRKMQSRISQSLSHQRNQQRSEPHKVNAPKVELTNIAAVEKTFAPHPETKSLSNQIVARRLQNAQPVAPATVDVFNFESTVEEGRTQRKQFKSMQKSTGVVGFDESSPRSQKKHLSPLQKSNGAIGDAEGRPNRKRMLNNGLFDTTGDLQGLWTDVSDYREEPVRRHSRRKESPRAAQFFGKTRVFNAYKNSSAGYCRLDVGYTPVKGNPNFDGPEKDKDGSVNMNGFRGQHAKSRRMMAKSMEQWRITSGR